MPERVGIERTRELLEDMCLMDDALFSKCFSEDTACTKLILDIILGRNDLTVTEVHTQRWIQNIHGHSVKLDIAARDAEGNLYDIEIQRTSDDSIRKRARFYSAMIDADCHGKGVGYDKLPESYVIFISDGDAIGNGQALYEVERIIKGTDDPYADGTHIIHVSASLADSDTELGRLMHDLKCADPEKMHYNVLRERTRFFKNEKEGLIDMSGKFDDFLKEALAEGMTKGIAKGRAEGRVEGSMETATDIARRMVANGTIPLPQIAEFSGLPLEEVESIRRSISL